VDWGDGPPQNLRWGTVHASVPSIFGEVVLWDTRVSTKCLQKGEKKEFLGEIEVFRQEEGHRPTCIWHI